MYLKLIIKIQKCNIGWVMYWSFKMSSRFVTYFRSLNPDEKKALAEKCKTSVRYLTKQATLINTGKEASLFKPSICTAIEVFSLGEITRKELRPDDWSDIWLELIDA